MILNVDNQSYEYEILDILEITLADSFGMNKIGTGNGEAVLYVGMENEKSYIFFKDLNNLNCFFLKEDFEDFLIEVEEEYSNPTQNYKKKEKMPFKLFDLKNQCNKMSNNFLYFQLYRVNRKPPRIFMKSNSEYYEFMRDVALPNISYLSIFKLRNLYDGSIWYYFKIFIDYRPDIVGYKTLEESRQEDIINHSFGISVKEKEKLIKARIGQGEYRNKLLEECPYCPFTMVNDERLLIASHIKPWVKSNDKEKIDPKNGFMFTPTYDKLFDRGFITFENDKTLKVSPWLSPMNQKRLGIYNGMLIEKLSLDDKREKYLKYHRENIFKG